MRTLVLQLTILLLLSGCLKRDESHVNVPCTGECMTFNIVVATGLNSTVPLANAAVKLGWSRPATPIGDAGRLIASGTTDSNGFVSFAFKAREKELQGGQFYVRAKKGDAYFEQDNSYFGISQPDSVVNVKVHVPSKAIVKIVYKNFVPTSDSDYFSCGGYFSTYGSSPLGVRMKTNSGNPADPFFLGKDTSFVSLELNGTTAGDQYTYLNIIRKKSGNRVDSRDSIYIGNGETKTYEVAF